MKPYRILIVEDENIVAMDIQDRLVAMGYESVGYSGNGRQALSMAMQHRPDLVLMDIRLKGDMDGIDTAKEIRKQYELPVIFLTAYAEDATLERAKQAEPFGYILKPFDDLKLKTTIEIAVIKHQSEQELRRMNRLYSALSHVNRSLGTVVSREEMMADVCRQMVEYGGIDLACVGWRGSVSHNIELVSCFGAESDLPAIDVACVNDKPSTQGSPTWVMDNSEPFISNDGLRDDPFHPFWHWMNNNGFQSVALFPIRFLGTTGGVLCVFVRKPEFFRQKEISLLEEVTLDIANALDKMDTEFRRNQAEIALRNSEEHMRLFFKHAPASLAMFDRNMRYLFVSQRWMDDYGLYNQDIIGRSHYDIFPEITEEWKQIHQRCLTGEIIRADEDKFIRADGSVQWLKWEVRPWNDNFGQIGGIVIFYEDITTRKNAEEAIQETEMQFRSIFELASVGIVQVEPRLGKLIRYNNKFKEMVGYSDEELGRISFPEFTHPEDRERDWELFSRAARGETQTYRNEKRYICKDGHVIWARLNAAFVRDKNQAPIRTIAICEDITEQKEVQEKLEQAEERFRQVADSANEWIWEVDADGLYTYSSSAVEQILGYTPDEIVGKKHFYDFFDHETQQSKLEMIFDGMRQRKYFSKFKSGRIHKDGRHVIVVSTAIPITDNKGVLLGYRGTHTDITEQIKAAETRDLLATVVEHSSEIVVVCDRQARITYVNPAFERITGYSAEEVNGLNPRLWKSGKHGNKFYREMWKTIASGNVWRGNLINKKKNGELFEEETTISSIKDLDGNIVNYVAMKRDVTKEAALQRQLIQSQKMEAIGTLAGGIAHDFNNILSAINGYTELAMDQLPAESQICSDLEQVLHAGRRAGEMVRQILTFSRQNSSEKHSISLVPLVKEGLKFLRAAIPSSIEIRQKINADTGKILGDPTQIHQVLMNLCTNASHAMKETAGILTVELSEIELSDDFTILHPPLKPGRHVRLQVADTGIGIASDIRNRIFEPYFTTKSVGEGTGMGLSVLLGIVQTHNGAVTVDSELGKGTVFDVYFPLAHQKEIPITEAELEKSLNGDECILLVDDEESLCLLMHRILQRLGYETIMKTNADAALECFRSNPQQFDLVITDLTMPIMTGVKLAAEIKKLSPEIPIILCTGAEQSVTDEMLEQAGIAAAIKKPISKVILANTIRQLLNQNNS